MIVPQYWAEAKVKTIINNRQLTIKRFGWSDESPSDALLNAETRVAEGVALFKAGEKTNKSEPKTPYNGADGVPIREEIICRLKDSVITRNSYGALCINTPDVLFADIDFEINPATKLYLFSFICLLSIAIYVGLFFNSWPYFGSLLIGALIFTSLLATLFFKVFIFLTGGVQHRAKKRIRKFSKKNPDWNLHIYRTPAGYRILVLHKTFIPNSEETLSFFHALKVDPIYIKMCQKQHCFRARVSPKPWRIGIDRHMKPRPGVWPIKAEKMEERQKWIKHYDHASRKYASCRFEEQIGSNRVAPKALYIHTFHDQYCKANTHLPIA